MELIGSMVFWGVAMLLIALVNTQEYTGWLQTFMIASSVGLGLIVGVAVSASAGEGHLNGAITTAMAVDKETSWLSVPVHLVTQTAGFWLIAKLALLIGEQYVVVPLPAADATRGQVLLAEGIAMVVFATGVALTTRLDLGKWLPLWVGAWLTAAVMTAASVSGGAVNPTLALGTQLATGQTGGVSGLWMLYWITTILAAIVVGLVFRLIPSRAESTN